MTIGKTLSLYLSIRRTIKPTVVITVDIIFASYVQNLFSILLSTLTPYAEEIIGDHQCGFQHNRPASEHILCIRYILEKWKYNEAEHQLFIDFKKAYDSVRMEVLYNNLIQSLSQLNW